MTEDEARQLFRQHCHPGRQGILEAYGERAAVNAILSALSASQEREARARAALEKIAAVAPPEKPDGPAYDCGNSGDVADDAARLAEWFIAEIARTALTTIAEGKPT